MTNYIEEINKSYYELRDKYLKELDKVEELEDLVDDLTAELIQAKKLLGRYHFYYGEDILKRLEENKKPRRLTTTKSEGDDLEI